MWGNWGQFNGFTWDGIPWVSPRTLSGVPVLDSLLTNALPDADWGTVLGSSLTLDSLVLGSFPDPSWGNVTTTVLGLDTTFQDTLPDPDWAIVRPSTGN